MSMPLATNTVLMIRPANFGFNPETAASNSFQNHPSGEMGNLNDKAVSEFELAVKILRNEDIHVLEFEDTETPLKTDAIFPNNWFTTAGNLLLTYPMESPLRRLERRPDIIKFLAEEFNYEIDRSLESLEKEGKFLEGTGSVVFDHTHKMAYACRSSRTHPQLVEKIADKLGYNHCIFDALDKKGSPIYHTNVMMCIGHRFAVICLDSIQNPKQLAMVKSSLSQSDHEIIPITHDQMAQFAGNMLELMDKDENPVLVMSETAYFCLDNIQIKNLQKYCRIVSIPVPTIEKVSGGSIRCMMAEIFH